MTTLIQKQSLRQSLSPQQVIQANILQLNISVLEKKILDELESNPLLEQSITEDESVEAVDELETEVEYDQDPDEYEPSNIYDNKNYTFSNAIKTKAFWIISIGHAQALLVVSAIGIHQVPYLENSLGFSKNSAAFAVMLLTAINMIGQMSGGMLADKFPKRKLAALTVLGHVLAMITLALATSTFHIVAYAIIQGLSWGARTPILTSMRGDYFGRAAFASIMGTSQSIAMIGMILGPLIVGYCADHYSYQTGFYVISALTAPGFLLLLSLEEPSP